MTALRVSDLRVELAAGGGEIVDEIGLELAPGEIAGLVGESGSGKTTVAVALLGHAKHGTRIARGSVEIGGVDLLTLPPEELRRARGKLVAYVPQDPSSALNPSLNIGAQLAEVMSEHGEPADQARILAALAEVRLPAARELLRRYPHQLSGGQQQRVCLAIAFLLRPALIVLDEPTTGLDVTTQAHVLATVRELCQSHDTAALYVSHDLAAVAALARRVLVMYAGRIVEEGPVGALFVDPAHPYTRKLIGAIPDIAARRLLEAIPGRVPPPGARPPGCVFAPRCSAVVAACEAAPPPEVAVAPGHTARCIRVGELGRPALAALPVREAPARAAALLEVADVRAFHGTRRVLDGVSLQLQEQECLAIVGESGSGKTTLARVVIGLHAAQSGAVRFRGELLPARAQERSRDRCRAIQYVFQSASSSLNPRRTIGEIVRTPLEHFFGLRGRAADERVAELLERVSLPAVAAQRYSGELSGGERQRVSIARALAAKPEILICDEITSALDTSVQAAIVRLLEDLQETEKLALLFVTHNLALVRTIADRVAVMHLGSIVEHGRIDAVLDTPAAAYTSELIADTPTMPSAVAGAGQ
jgi:oligopeptide/dipeptide ABC transporter ATP-binding protein